MRMLATISLGLACLNVPLNAAVSPDNTTGPDSHSKISQIAAPLDWNSKDVRIEVRGDQTQVILRRQTFKGVRRLGVDCEMNDAKTSVTLVYWVYTFVGPITKRGLDFEQADLDIVWTFDTKKFEKMKAERKFYVLCKGEGADIG